MKVSAYLWSFSEKLLNSFYSFSFFRKNKLKTWRLLFSDSLFFMFPHKRKRFFLHRKKSFPVDISSIFLQYFFCLPHFFSALLLMFRHILPEFFRHEIHLTPRISPFLYGNAGYKSFPQTGILFFLPGIPVNTLLIQICILQNHPLLSRLMNQALLMASVKDHKIHHGKAIRKMVSQKRQDLILRLDL